MAIMKEAATAMRDREAETVVELSRLKITSMAKRGLLKMMVKMSTDRTTITTMIMMMERVEIGSEEDAPLIETEVEELPMS